jgi:polar amino acid transport system substrate-binding protein
VAMKTVNEQGLPRSAEVDMTFTNATTVRAKDVDFTAPLVSLELGYLVSTAANIRQLADIDKPGVNVGVAQGSSSQGALAKAYSAAKLVTTPSLKEAQTQLMAGRLQAFATNKAILYELLDGLPAGQFKVLDERWGLEHLAIAVPKGRESGQAFLQQFSAQMVSTGRLQSLIDHAGLRGTAKEN